MDCQELLEQLGDYLDREAREELCRAIEEHLETCRDCKVVVDKTRKTILLYQEDRQVDLPVAVTAGLQAALMREYHKTANATSD